MKEFLQDLQQLLIKHPDKHICGNNYTNTVVIFHVGSTGKGRNFSCFETAGITLRPSDVQRFIKELGAEL